MPPRISLLQASRCSKASLDTSRAVSASSLVSLLASLSLQTRNASILSNLSDNKGAYQKRIRRGRGPSSGYGKTSGRGHKGQKQHGKVKPWFQGGQTPLVFSHGRKGFENVTALDIAIVNLDRIQTWIDIGRIDPTKRITPKELVQSGCVGSVHDGIKLLAGGKTTLRTPIDIIVSRASASAIEAVEAAGGRVVTRYFTRDSIRRLIRGESVITDQPLPVGAEHVESVLERARSGPHLYRLPDPTSRWDIEYYRDPAHRGYLSHLLKPGESPSLYFKVPREMGTDADEVDQAALQKAKEDADRLF
ncbi:hypothetical protein VTK73DRAFT_9863 [Phialemonium thermophilum]|uniref:Large ribosomal subunit protein uL15/eL18 domain-containing protein n=1 Tax=Phialemonium thermophilum TaxID=223376 RepID=A0ABR3XJ48_9PEZI